MGSQRSPFRCQACGSAAAKWTGRCSGCGAWNTVREEPTRAALGSCGTVSGEAPVVIADIDGASWAPRPTGVGGFDRVLGGGLVPGSVTLLGGEPGVGKSTLLVQVLARVSEAGATCLLVSGEESSPQVRLRAQRLGALNSRLWLLCETLLPSLVSAVDEIAPQTLVVDSIQSLLDPQLGVAPGTVSQVRQCAAQLVRVAKERGISMILVGHVTKDGSLAGPRVLEHVVDTVLAFEGDRHHALRLLRAVKHRFGPTSELGLFEMADDGLHEVPDPSALFLGDRHPGVPGSAVVPTLEGHRPLLVEVQALVAPSRLSVPRRSSQGLDPARLALVLAVLERRCRLPLSNAEVYGSSVGGVRVMEPAADLALALALASSLTAHPVPADLVACGEVGLGGELRQVGQTARRLAEAARLGFRRALVPSSAPDPPPGLDLLRANCLAEAITLAGVGPAWGAFPRRRVRPSTSEPSCLAEPGAHVGGLEGRNAMGGGRHRALPAPASTADGFG